MAQHRKRWAPKALAPDRIVNDPLTFCPHCGKACYTSRKRARAKMRSLFPGEHMSAYQCHGYWHVGHMPSRVKAGDRDRAELRDG